MLEFEHIVQVNDLTNSSLITLTRNQLWQGLVLRALNPEKFNDGLSCSCEKITESEFVRTVAAGGSIFCERVRLHPVTKISTNTVPAKKQILAESVTTIEEPKTDFLFVRFNYRRELDDRDERVAVGEHLKAAYVQVDRDAISMIRELAAAGLFDQSIN